MADGTGSAAPEGCTNRTLASLGSRLTDTQRTVFDELWSHLLRTGKSLPVQTLQRAIGKADQSVVLQGLSGSLLFEEMENGRRYLRLTMLGALLSGHGTYLIGLLVRLLEVVKRLYESGDESQHLTSEFLYEQLELRDGKQQAMLFHLMNLGLIGPWPIRSLGGVAPEGGWKIEITDHIVDLYTADNVRTYLEKLLLCGYDAASPRGEQERLQRILGSASLPEAGSSWFAGSGIGAVEHDLVYRRVVSEGRMSELRALHHPDFDCSRLVALCHELAECSARGYVHASIMLTRAILDHVPPIFDYGTFSEVANNYGGRAFKDAMRHLDECGKNIANIHLHTQIQRKHSLPQMVQADFAAPLDLLLSEVVKILSSSPMSDAKAAE